MSRIAFVQILRSNISSTARQSRLSLAVSRTNHADHLFCLVELLRLSTSSTARQSPLPAAITRMKRPLYYVACRRHHGVRSALTAPHHTQPYPATSICWIQKQVFPLQLRLIDPSSDLERPVSLPRLRSGGRSAGSNLSGEPEVRGVRRIATYQYANKYLLQRPNIDGRNH